MFVHIGGDNVNKYSITVHVSGGGGTGSIAGIGQTSPLYHSTGSYPHWITARSIEIRVIINSPLAFCSVAHQILRFNQRMMITLTFFGKAQYLGYYRTKLFIGFRRFK